MHIWLLRVDPKTPNEALPPDSVGGLKLSVPTQVK